jgi:hypothetical protein
LECHPAIHAKSHDHLPDGLAIHMTDSQSDAASSDSRRGWRFNFSKVRNFRVLPKTAPPEENTSGNDVPDSPPRSTWAIRPPKFLSVTDISQSRIEASGKRFPLGDTTMESLQLESQEIALREAMEHSEQLKHERDELQLELRRLKSDHQRQLSDFRAHIEKTAGKLERTTGILRSQVMAERERLDAAESEKEADERFVRIREAEEHIRNTKQSFVNAQESVAALASVLQYSPLAESEFNVIESVGTFESPVGKAVAEFIAAAKKVLVRPQENVSGL